MSIAPEPEPSTQSAAASAGPHYQVALLQLHAHLYDITLHIPEPAPLQRVSLPVWIPGSYLVREFSQHLQGLQAECDGAPVPLQQVSKNTWDIATPAQTQTLTLRYQVYARDASVRGAWLDAGRAFFNPTSLCLRVHGQESQAHTLALHASAAQADWQVATALSAAAPALPLVPSAPIQPTALGAQPSPAGIELGRFVASDYDHLADSPFELGSFWSGSFTLRGVPHRLVVSGAGPGFDAERLLRDTERICAAALAFWHGSSAAPPFARYLFLLHARADGYGGLEHQCSTALLCSRADLPRRERSATTPVSAPDGYSGLLGLISHEYFHAWHVKRLRPHTLARYDYERENYTDLLWLFEGFTSYYDDLLLRRAGLIDDACYLQLLGKTLNQVLQTPGRQVQSLAQASFDAWVKYYRSHENTPNATVSYYAKGALVALALDLRLRDRGSTDLDTVLRTLYARCQGGPMVEADLYAVLEQLGQHAVAAELAAWVHGRADPPWRELLQAHGIAWQLEPAPLALRLGLRLSTEGGALSVQHVLRGGRAEQAGFAAGDEWLGLECPQTGTERLPGAQPADGRLSHASSPVASAWRIRKLDDLALVAPAQGGPVLALVARDGRLLRLRLDWPPAPKPAPQLTAADPAAAQPAPGSADPAAARVRLNLAPGDPGDPSALPAGHDATAHSVRLALAQAGVAPPWWGALAPAADAQD